MTDDELVSEVLDGKTRIWRFTAEEQGGSSFPADRFLWLGILRAEHELASAIFGGMPEGAESSSRGPAAPCRFLKEFAIPMPSDFNGLVAEIGRYEDRGQESIVCDSGDGFVSKLRPMRPSILTGYLAPLANIVYPFLCHMVYRQTVAFSRGRTGLRGRHSVEGPEGVAEVLRV